MIEKIKLIVASKRKKSRRRKYFASDQYMMKCFGVVCDCSQAVTCLFVVAG